MLIEYVLFRKRRAKYEIQPRNVHVIARNPLFSAIYNYELLLNASIYVQPHIEITLSSLNASRS